MDSWTLHILQQTAEYFHNQGQQAYLVGGSVRNLLLETPCLDWDIVTDGNAHALARRLADKLGGYYAHMHDKASRVTVKKEQELIFDIAPLVGKSLEEDLRQRDFTMNAIAVPLSELVQHLTQGIPLKLIDPLHGKVDIEMRRLRAVNSDIFRHDPLRMLRAVRLMGRYQLTIESGTESLILRDASLLSSVAAERIHDELFAILEPVGATERLRYLDAHGLLTVLIPEFTPARGMLQNTPHYWDVLDHSLETVGMLEQLAALLHSQPEEIQQSAWETSTGDLVEIQRLIQEAERQSLFHLTFLTLSRMKLAALLHDIGKPVTYSTDEDGYVHFYGHPQLGVPLIHQVLKRLNASTQDRRLVQQVTAHHMRPGQLGQDGIVTPRAIRRYFIDLGPTGIAIALFSLADHLATLGPQPVGNAWERHVGVVRLLLTRYICERESVLPPQLINADELMRRLKLEPGPLIGQLLEQIAEAQADGLIHSKEEALWFLEEKLGYNLPDSPL